MRKAFQSNRTVFNQSILRRWFRPIVYWHYLFFRTKWRETPLSLVSRVVRSVSQSYPDNSTLPSDDIITWSIRRQERYPYSDATRKHTWRYSAMLPAEMPRKQFNTKFSVSGKWMLQNACSLQLPEMTTEKRKYEKRTSISPQRKKR